MIWSSRMDLSHTRLEDGIDGWVATLSKVRETHWPVSQWGMSDALHCSEEDIPVRKRDAIRMRDWEDGGSPESLSMRATSSTHEIAEVLWSRLIDRVRLKTEIVALPSNATARGKEALGLSSENPHNRRRKWGAWMVYCHRTVARETPAGAVRPMQWRPQHHCDRRRGVSFHSAGRRAGSPRPRRSEHPCRPRGASPGAGVRIPVAPSRRRGRRPICPREDSGERRHPFGRHSRTCHTSSVGFVAG